MAPIHSFAGKFSRVAFAVTAPRSSSTDHNQYNNHNAPSVSEGSFCLEQVCKSFGASPVDNLFISSAGERGNSCILRKPVEKGGVILRIPLSSCLRDDEPPGWYEFSSDNKYASHLNEDWACRLAASLLDIELTSKLPADDALASGRETWLSLLPDRDVLRASLPVHWDDQILSRSKCYALELAVDEAYFARAETVARLTKMLSPVAALDCDKLERKCHDALDIVSSFISFRSAH